MGQVLYRKYRSRSFDEVVGQEHVTKTLENALKTGRISHAYLFTGPRGVGKTSVARILAHEVNGLAYKDEGIHLDIIEIDAASNRRIDEIRELRERVHIAPSSAKYKVYIIDEVHMLTREAFNALLKILEEPPAHCIFILATTEAHKLPDTIVSRTQRFNFKPVTGPQAAKHLESIAKKEKIAISAQALELLAEHGTGSFRDSISLLDQLSASRGPIDEPAVLDMLGLPAPAAVDKLFYDVRRGDTPAVLTTLEGLREQGANAAAIAKQLAKKLRAAALEGSSGKWVPELLKELLAVPASAEPYDYLEICLLKAAGDNVEEIVGQEPPAAKTAQPAKHAEGPGKTAFAMGSWDSIVNKAKAETGSLYSALRLARPELSGATLKLFFKFPLHQKKLAQAGNVNLLGRLIEETTGTKLKIESLMDKAASGPNQTKPQRPKPDKVNPSAGDQLNSISNIFGDAEVLES